jgi:hypothetical protein
MKSYIKIITLSLACVLISGVTSASTQDETWWNKTGNFLTSAGKFGYDFVRTIVVSPGQETTELAFVPTSKGLVIKSIPVKEDDINLITDLVSGCKGVYRRGLKENLTNLKDHVSKNKWRVTCDSLALMSGFDPYGVSQLSALTLHSGKMIKDTYHTLPKIIRFRAPTTEKLLMTGTFFFCASLPVANAYNSLSQAKSAYGGWGCGGKKAGLTESFLDCVEGGQDFKTCFLDAPREIEGVEYDGYTFQMHPTDSDPRLAPVSITNYDKNQVCIIAGTDPNGFATKICSDMGLSGGITVTQTSMKFSEAHEGLDIGTIVYHGASKVPEEGSCAFFKEFPTELTDPGENVICVASGFNPDFPQQTCIDPTTHVVTVRGLTPEQYLDLNPDPSNPYVIIRDPRSLNIDVRPDSLENMDTCSIFDAPALNTTNAITTCDNPHVNEEWFNPTGTPTEDITSIVVTEEPCMPSISFWQILKAYYYQDLRYAEPSC